MKKSYTGQTINGYKIGPLLGIGGMGEVYQAFKSGNSSDPYAIKFLRKEFMDDAQLQARFIREIQIMEAVEHPNIVPIFDHGQTDGQLYYSMRLIGGMSLATLLRRKKFSPISYWKILKQLAAAMHCAHENNVVHRDIKPSNIFVERTPDNDLHLFLGDFGLGKREGQDVTVTDAGAIIGTPHYLSPEAILGKTPSVKSDIYALAVLTYRALLGKLPFDNPHAHRVAMAHVTRPVPLPTGIAPDFPDDLEFLILTGLAKKPDDRPATAQAFADEYLHVLRELSEEERSKIYYSDDTPGLVE